MQKQLEYLLNSISYTIKTEGNFGIDNKRNLIIHFPVFIQTYTQQVLILYQL